MARLRSFILAGLFAAVLSSGSVFAQTVANLSVVSGNGQVVCLGCAGYASQFFEPLTVKATDSAGRPVSGASVTWTVASGQLLLPSMNTLTGADGTASITPYVQINSGTAAFLQASVKASAGTPSATFTLNQAFPVSGGYSVVQVTQVTINGTPAYGSAPISGPSGTQYAIPITLHVDTSGYMFGNAISNVSVRLVSDDADPTSTVSCLTQAGADPGSVLTDANGNASCTPVFGGVAGAAKYHIVVGGVAQSQTGNPFGFWSSIAYTANVTAAAPAMIQKLSGNGQSANQGAALAAPLVAKVTDASGNPVSGQAVTFAVTPASAGSATPIQSTSDSNGQVSANLTFSGTAAGTVTVTVALANSPGISATFTETANVPVQASGLQKNSGDNQTAVIGTTFSHALVVTVNGTNGPLANYPVQFAITGPATLSAASATTGSDGRAQVTVTAGATAGAVVVTASAAGASPQTFNLSVTPVGPNVTAASFYNAAGFQQGSLSPCGIAAIIATGIAPGIQGSVGPVIFGPMSREIALGSAGAKVSVSFGGTLAPIYSASNVNGQEQLNVQVPCEVVPGPSVAVAVNVGAATKTVNIPAQPASPGIFTTTAGMTDGVERAALLRPDGSWVSLANPARKGETIRLYATGLGATLPALSTGSLPAPGADALVQGTVIVGYGNSSGGAGGARLISARALPDEVGVYEVAFQLPADSAAGNNVALSMGVIPVGSSTVYYSNTVKMPVQ